MLVGIRSRELGHNHVLYNFGKVYSRWIAPKYPHSAKSVYDVLVVAQGGDRGWRSGVCNRGPES